MSANKKNLTKTFDIFSNKATKITGRPIAFLLAITIIIVWIICGPFVNFSDTWLLIINTITTIITFLMVFIIQQSQNKDTIAIQLKLNELLAATKGASNRLIDIESLGEHELVQLKNFYISLSKQAETEADLRTTHSLDETDENRKLKTSSD